MCASNGRLVLHRIPDLVNLPTRTATGPRSMVTHWPLGAAVKIHGAARSIGALACLWSSGDATADYWTHQHPRCTDLGEAADTPQAELTGLRTAALSDEVRHSHRVLGALSHDFQTISAWLARTTASAWDSVDGESPRATPALTLGECHRVAAKDRLAAEMNALVAWQLRQALKLLGQVPLGADAIRDDLAGGRCYGDVLRTAVELLEHAAGVASASEVFVENLDHGWHRLRHRVALVVDAAGGWPLPVHAEPAQAPCTAHAGAGSSAAAAHGSQPADGRYRVVN